MTPFAHRHTEPVEVHKSGRSDCIKLHKIVFALQIY
jgi:hypothetical protein